MYIVRTPFIFVRAFYDILEIDLWVGIALFLPCSFLLGYGICCRYWIFYYQSKITQFEKNKDWRMAIDPIHESDNWYVKNNNRFGNEMFLFKLILVLTLIQSLIYVALYFTFGVSPNLADSWLYFSILMLLVFGLTMLYKIKRESLKDNLGILKEIKLAAWFCVFLVCFSIIISYILWFYFPMYYDLTLVYLFIIISIGYMYIMIPYSQRLFDNYNNNNSSTKDENTIAMDVNVDIRHWWQFVCIYDGFVAFMNHLGTEFSSENLLFIQEVMC